MIEFVARRIGRRIGVIIGLTMAVFGVVGVLFVLGETTRTQEEADLRLARLVADTISVSFRSFDSRTGGHAIADITAELSNRDEIKNLEIFDDTGRIRWAIDPGRKGTMIDAATLRSISTGAYTTGERDAQGTVIVPLHRTSSCLPCHNKSPDPIGGIRIAANDRKLLGAAETMSRQAIAVVVCFGVFITCLLLLLINRFVVARISKLVEVMSKAEDGDFLVRAEVASNDEIGLLASTFNKMLAKITDLRVEHIDKDRHMHEVLDELSLKAEIAKRGELIEAANQTLSARLKQLSFLYNLGHDLASELELDALLERFGELVNTSLGVPEFVVLLLDRSKGQLGVVKAHGFKEGDIVERGFDVVGGLTGEVMKTREPLYVPDIEKDGRALLHRTEKSKGSVLIVPVIYQDSSIGLLVFSSPVVDKFRAEDCELFGAIANHAALALANAQLFQKTLQLSNTDGLTGTLNRRAMEARLDLEWSRSHRDQTSLSLIMIDIDHFKFFNDQNGHQLGDETLRRVARILEKNVRKVDAVARYGGEEFVVILPRATKAEAVEVANKLRRSVEQSDFLQGYMQPLGRVTISCGVAGAPEDSDNVAQLITCADDALFRAKQTGRNQVIAYSKLRMPSFSRPSMRAPMVTPPVPMIHDESELDAF